MVSEKVGGAEGTKLDEEFKDLERVRDLKTPRKWPLFSDTAETKDRGFHGSAARFGEKVILCDNIAIAMYGTNGVMSLLSWL